MIVGIEHLEPRRLLLELLVGEVVLFTEIELEGQVMAEAGEHLAEEELADAAERLTLAVVIHVVGGFAEQQVHEDADRAPHG